ncbi:MAG: amidohydrolase [Deltaproteobacteria bacterium]|nr:amidohydrolase [Deltaproteobacteria bacterium]
MDLKQIVSEEKARIIDVRRDLHRIPEIGFQVEKTSAYVARCLKAEGLSVQTGIARSGVVGLMETGSPGPCLMIRADMDALPVREETGLPFTSTHENAMHACGHDGHMAMALGAARILNRFKHTLKGRVKFLFQPAEEGPGGAKPMIDAGVMEDPRVDYAVGCHLWPNLPQGTIGVRAGPLMAAMDRFEIIIKGKGGHGAMPHQCVDALDTGVQVINALHRIVSRQMDPLMPTVVTVGSFHAGTAFNVIPASAEIWGTTRTFDRKIWKSWQGRIETIVRGVCRSMGADYELTYGPGIPPLINDPSMARVVRECAGNVVGPQQVVEPEPTMGGEDMAFYLEQSKGCFFFMGTGYEGCAPLHSPRFDFNEDVLPLGVEMFCWIALRLLS